MSNDDREFRIRPGRPRSTPAPRSGSFVNQVLRAARKAGPVRKAAPAGGSSSSGRPVRTGHSTFGRSRLFSPQRRVVVKARVVRQRAGPSDRRRGRPISAISSARAFAATTAPG
ncbi:hypothetical protein [Paracoccus versutus]